MNAIEKVLGPCVILAGAGTGKTYTIVEKVKYLISNKIFDPGKIVCLTFSNEAVNNLSLRINKAIEEFNNNVQVKPIVRTFHGFSADLLREYGDKINIDKKFKILDPDQAKVMLHRNLRINVNNCHKYINTISTAKDLGIQINEFDIYLSLKEKEFSGIDLENQLENLTFTLQTLHLRYDSKKRKDLHEKIQKIKNIIDTKKFMNAWKAYEKLKLKGNYQDYSDLTLNALILLQKYPSIALNFQYIIVDEFQDTNKIQLDFLINLAQKRNITIVGDLNQSIYRFRGAYKDNISLFKKAFNVSERDIFELSKSYRSPNKILEISHILIKNNYKNEEECFFVENIEGKTGEDIEAYALKDSKEEARKIIELINREQERGTYLEDICIMFRTHQQGRILRKAFEENDIKYVAASKASLLKQKSIKISRDFLIILNKLKKREKGGEEIWWDLIYQLNFSPGDLIIIGKTIKQFNKEESNYKGDKKEITEKIEPISLSLLNLLNKLELSNMGKTLTKILLDKINEMLKNINKPISELIKEVYRIAGLINDQRTKQEKEIMLNLNKFYEIAKAHEDLYDSNLDNFLYYLEVLENLGIEIEASSLEEEGVRLMTSHATKGLEFEIVIITNLAQGRFPIEYYTRNNLIPTELFPEVKNDIKSMNEEQKEFFIKNYEKHHQLLEERRLAYVSFTRAKKKLILTFAEQYGGKRFFPSQFLSEIKYKNNPHLIFTEDREQKYKEKDVFAKKELSLSHTIPIPEFKESLSLITESKEEKKEEHKRFSPSALLLFYECQKKFEYKYVYNMPERKTISWEAMRLGSFVHLVLEKGVSLGFKSAEEFLFLAREMSMNENWESIALKEAEALIKVFFERNKNKYDEKSKTEQYLPLRLGNLSFIGFADRIDFTDNGVDIIDYKTGKTSIALKDRNWQLGFYALAAQEKYGSIRKVVLDMLKQERPLEFQIDKQGNALCISSQFIEGFNIYNIKEEIIATAKQILDAYEKGFKPCPIEKNCDFCNEYVYGL